MAVRDRFLRGYETVGCLEFHAAGPGIARAAERIFHKPTTAVKWSAARVPVIRARNR